MIKGNLGRNEGEILVEASHWIPMWVYIAELFIERGSQRIGQRSASNRMKGMNWNIHFIKI